MTNCININLPEVQQLAKDLNLHPAVLGSKIALWQDKNNEYGRFPTALELKDEVEDEFQLAKKKQESVDKILKNSDLYTIEEVDNDKIKGVKKELLDSSGKTRRYVNKQTGDIIYHRVTDKQTDIFVQRMGKEEAEKINSLPDNIIKRDKGTDIHAVNDAIITNIISLTTSKFIDKQGLKNKIVLNKEEIKKLAGLNDAQYTVLRDNLGKLLNQIIDQQRAINPNGKVTILTEALLIDDRVSESVGGTTDVVSIFSDNTASIYDFKNLTPNPEYLDKNRVLIKSPIPSYKRESYHVQLAKYKEILKERYGINEVRQTRIIPIRLEYKLKPKDQRSVDKGFITNELTNIWMGEEMSPWLKQVPVAFEKTGDKNLDQLINFQERIIHNLEKELNNKYNERDTERVERLHESVANLRLKRDYQTTINDVKKLIIEIVGKDQMSGRLSINDKDNYLYMTTRELMDAREDLSVYKALGADFRNILLDFAATDKKLYMEEKEDINKLVGAVSDTISAIEEKLLERIDEVAKSKGENINNVDVIDISIFDRKSEVSHPIFRTFDKLVSERQNKTRLEVNKLNKEIETLLKDIKSFDALLNDKGNMHSRLDKKFWAEREKAYKSRDIEWFKDNYVVNQKWKDNYIARLEAYKAKLELKHEDEFLVNKKLDQWIQKNNSDNTQYWFGGASKWQTKLKDEVYDKYKSDEFKNIEKDPALLKFYELVEKKNSEFRHLLGLGYQELPDNFLPNMRKETIEKVLAGEFKPGEHYDEIVKSLSIRESEDGSRIGLGIDPVTGEAIPQIPMFYINSLRNEEGKIDGKLKTKELGTALLLFAEMAYNYQNMSAIETDVNALKFALEEGKIKTLQLNNRGQKFKDFTGDWAEKLGIDTNAVEKFKAFQNYYIYGIKIDNSMIKNDTLLEGSDISKTKTLLAAKNFLAVKMLGANVIGASAAYLASRTNLHYEAVKGQYFTTENSRAATKTLVSDWTKYHALTEFIEPFADNRTGLKAQNLKLSNVSKYVSMEMLMAPYRKADERLDSQIVNAMAHNWGVDEKGGIMRMDKLQKHFEKLNEDNKQRGLKKTYSPKSIWELSQMNEKNDEFKVEGLSEEGYTMFRNAVRKAKANITGLMSDEDINYANINLYTNLMMQFKNWMPGMYKERFGSIKYDRDLDLADQGKYGVLTNELFSKEANESYGRFATMMAKSALTMAADIATFGIPKRLGMGSFYKINQDKAKAQYEAFLKEHPSADPNKNDGKGLTFEDFVQMKQNQLASGLAEFRILLIMMMIMLALGGDWDDDGERDYRKYWATRQLYRVVNRTQMELGFSTNPQDFIKLVQTPLPLVRLLIDISQTLSNTVDESRDVLIGENSSNDKTPISYYSSQWVPGVRGARRVVDMFYEQDKSAER